MVVPPDGQSAGTFTINPYRTVYGYTADGKVHTKKTPVGTATYLYNKDGSVVLQTDPAGATSTAYDTLNRKCWTARTKTPILSPVCSSAPTGATKYTYEDTTTAAKTVTDPDGHTTTDTYGNAELPTSPTVVYDPDGTQVTYNAYNVFGDTCVSGPVNPSRVTCPITTTTVSGDSVWTYSAEGNLRKSVDPTGVATNYTYTDRTYPTSPTVVTYAGRATSAAYNANGEVKWQHDAEGTYVSTQYGADSEPCWSGPTFSSAACTSAPSGTGVSTYTYNSVGELTQMVDNHGTGHSHTDTYGYDKDGNETSASDDNSRTVAYTYNDANQVKCIAYPIKPSPNCATAPGTTNTVVDRTYNTAGQLAHTKDWLGNTVSYAEYTPNGHLGRITYPSSTGETVDYTYDAAQNLTKVSYHGTSLAGQTDTYSYNGDEQLSASSGIVTSPSDTYNSYKQVSKASDPISATASVTHTYHYSDAGDVTSVTPTGGGSAQTFSYNSKHELTTSVTPVATNTLSSTPRAPISISGYPSTVAMAPSGATAYVANQSASTLTPIDVATDTAGTAISLPDVTDSIAITPSGSKAYLTSKSGNEVIPVTLSTSTAGTPISCGHRPHRHRHRPQRHQGLCRQHRLELGDPDHTVDRHRRHGHQRGDRSDIDRLHPRQRQGVREQLQLLQRDADHRVDRNGGDGHQHAGHADRHRHHPGRIDGLRRQLHNKRGDGHHTGPRNDVDAHPRAARSDQHRPHIARHHRLRGQLVLGQCDPGDTGHRPQRDDNLGVDKSPRARPHSEQRQAVRERHHRRQGDPGHNLANQGDSDTSPRLRLHGRRPTVLVGGGHNQRGLYSGALGGHFRSLEHTATAVLVGADHHNRGLLRLTAVGGHHLYLQRPGFADERDPPVGTRPRLHLGYGDRRRHPVGYRRWRQCLHLRSRVGTRRAGEPDNRVGRLPGVEPKTASRRSSTALAASSKRPTTPPTARPC